ncbi:putative ATP-dependent RNA helicase DHX57 isoform X2 [Diachasma alloeum]|uniref:putative ATP-dependent RNA helicase DHX57 isoform X2 n=1 Tax=Diachasma alloeum TaxID=454923 RepID=UPI0007384011|nr:putative ATP-dependent RNA helicase DHX57 isoform X2 [Diachasma alloeum]
MKMDYLSVQLMDDIVLDSKKKPNTSSNDAVEHLSKFPRKLSKLDVNNQPKPAVRCKVELQTLRISEESERQLYETLKQIYGDSFKLSDASHYQNKRTNLGKQYWMERGDLVIRGVVDYSSREAAPKTHAQLTKHFATSKLESYSYYSLHCAEALDHTDGDVGKALEILFEKYYRVHDLSKICGAQDFDVNDLLSVREEEKCALEAIYGDSFVQTIKNRLWTVTLKLFLTGKCRFGAKCRFLHQQPESLKHAKKFVEPDPSFTLEIRFPEDSKYPYEAPFFYFYKTDLSYPSEVCLVICKKLYEDAILRTPNGEPCIFELISILENSEEMKDYLENTKPSFISKHDSLFSKSTDDTSNNLASHHQKGSTNRSNKDKISLEEIQRQDEIICQKFMEKLKNSRYLKMKESRRKLPAWSMMTEVLEAIEQNQVTIISGETGCGKSTQVPQFILDDWIINRNVSGAHIEIIGTQPRRISAIGVADRVAAERDERVGQTVGYQIALESKMSVWTRLTFCTTGILLQRLSSDPHLKTITHVIVDEVHERSADSDFLLMLLREILPYRSDLRIILMSATLKAELFASYFKGPPILDIPGRTFPVKPFFLEEILQKINYVFEENSEYARKIKGGWDQVEIGLASADLESLSSVSPRNTLLDGNLNLAQLIGRYPGLSMQTYKNLYVMDQEKINYDLLEKILEWIIDGDHDYPREGSILVFLPGLAEITTLRDVLNHNSVLSSRAGRCRILPLHSSLSTEEQNLVFEKVDPRVRKIVLSTNIAETSVTIDDCVFVVDTGRMKETRFNSNQNMASLDTCWISRANAMQRKGRAGRVRPGVCIHMYTSHKLQHHLLPQPIPEILRISLEPLLLKILKMNLGNNINVYEILNRILDPPQQLSISDSIVRLQDVGAIDLELNLTPLGHHLATLPVDVRIGKLILYGVVFCCLDSALTIAACLSHKSPFSSPFEKRHQIDAKKKEFTTAFSDQLTTLKAYKKWLEMSARGFKAGLTFAKENYLSVRTLQTLADMKHQFLELLIGIGFVPIDAKKRTTGVDKVLEFTGVELNANNENYKLLQGLLCAALYPNVVRICTPEKSFQVQSSGAIPRQPKAEELRFETKNDGLVFIHPSSVNFSIGHFPSPYLAFQEKIKTSKVYIRDVSMVSMLPLVLFSGYGVNIEQHNGTFILSLADGWILFKVETHTVAQLLQNMRTELVKLLELKMQDPLLNLLNHQNGRKIIATIINVLTND